MHFSRHFLIKCEISMRNMVKAILVRVKPFSTYSERSDNVEME